MRLIEERRGSSVISYVYEPGSYVPLARIDAEGDETEQGGLGTSKEAKPEEQAANDDTMEGRYWASLRAQAQKASALLPDEPKAPKLGNIYYFHNDVNGCPEELSNAQGKIVWQATYKTWGSTVTEEWEVRELDGGAPLFGEGDKPQGEYQQQNLRFQGQYLDRDTGLHYNTFRYYDPDIGRFVSPDPIGLAGGLNLHSYSPNPIAWIDPWGLCRRGNSATKQHMDQVRDQFGRENQGSTHQAGGREVGTGRELPETHLGPTKGPGGSYTDMTFKDAQGRTVYIQTVDKGNYGFQNGQVAPVARGTGMSEREATNAVRISSQNPNAIIITVPKGNSLAPGSLNTGGMTPGNIYTR